MRSHDESDAGAVESIGGESAGLNTSPSVAFLRELVQISAPRPRAETAPGDERAPGETLDEPAVPPRFTLGKRLGSGGFGVVFEAFDHEQRAAVALKRMRRRDPRSLYLFKQEFRALSELTHRNLVQLYELHAEGEAWFFTMELIRGESAAAVLRAPFDEARARDLFGQLAEGLLYLHESGRLHLDVKPSNVMITGEGRVVLLDFGLAADIRDGWRARALSGAGTPGYMAPEQAEGEPLTPAADWFAVGVMLYEALTGELPFEGRRGPRRSAPPSAIAEGAPEDLSALAMDLLEADPARRPGGREVMRRLAARPMDAEIRLDSDAVARKATPFVGRERHLRELKRALEEADRGRTVVVLAHGPSGAGKTALAQRFLEEVRDRSARGEERGRIALAGRCFEQESVPYKTLDSLIDALCQELQVLPAEEMEALLPPDIATLARLFPVLRQLPAVRGGARPEDADQPELRRRAVAALRGLLARAGAPNNRARGAPVLAVDDLHWGDLDGAALLLDALCPTGAPPLLFLATYRSEEAETSPALRAILEGLRDELHAGVLTVDLPIDELSPAEAEALARALLGEGADRAAALAAESRGNPFFLTELAARSDEDRGLSSRSDAAYASAGGAVSGAPLAELDAIFRARVLRLPDPARRLLEVVAAAGQPIARGTAAAAAFDPGAAAHEPGALAVLRGGHLVRVQRARNQEELLPYHDRIAKAVLGLLSPDAERDAHLRLALAFVASKASGEVEPERLLGHFERAGRLPEAALYARQAADLAFDALAFDRAARLYRRALALDPPAAAGGEARRAVRAKLADALSGAGRLREAAEENLEVAREQPQAQALLHKRKAMEQLLLGGYVDEGMRVLGDVLRGVGLAEPRSSLRALASVGLRRIAARLRGIAALREADQGAGASAGGAVSGAAGSVPFPFRKRAEAEIPEIDLLRIDTCASAVLGLSIVDPVQAADYQARHLELALAAGEPRRVARALTLEGIHRGLRAGPSDSGAERTIAAARALLDPSGSPLMPALSDVARGTVAIAQSEWARARDLLLSAQAALRDQPAPAAWERDYVAVQLLLCYWMLGSLREIAAAAPALLQSARERGNLHLETMVRVNAGVAIDLAADDPKRAREALRGVLERWPRRAFLLQHLHGLLALARIALYEGRGREALRLFAERGPWVARSGLLAVSGLKVEVLFWRGAAGIAAAREGSPVGLALAAWDARRLASHKNATANALSGLLHAAIARRRGRSGEAIALLGQAEARLSSAPMALFAAAARRRRGAWIGGEEGRALASEADAWLRAQAIESPARMAGLLAPDASLDDD